MILNNGVLFVLLLSCGTIAEFSFPTDNLVFQSQASYPSLPSYPTYETIQFPPTDHGSSSSSTEHGSSSTSTEHGSSFSVPFWMIPASLATAPSFIQTPSPIVWTPPPPPPTIWTPPPPAPTIWIPPPPPPTTWTPPSPPPIVWTPLPPPPIVWTAPLQPSSSTPQHETTAAHSTTSDSWISQLFSHFINPFLNPILNPPRETPKDSPCQQSPPYAQIDYGVLSEKISTAFSTFAFSRAEKSEISFMCRKPDDKTMNKIDFKDIASVMRLNMNLRFGFYFHGLAVTCYDSWMDELMNVWSTDEQMNVCCLDWKKYSLVNSLSIYGGGLLDDIARFVADDLLQFERNTGIQKNRFVFVGQALGAQIIGLTTKSMSSPKVPLCFALNMGAMLYSLHEPSNKFTPMDCEHTKAWYTQMPSNQMTFGAVENVIFNGGAMQPHCHDALCTYLSPIFYWIESMKGKKTGKHFFLRSPDGTPVDVLDAFGQNRVGTFLVNTTNCYPYFPRD